MKYMLALLIAISIVTMYISVPSSSPPIPPAPLGAREAGIVLHVLTWSRASSCARLLASLQKAQYPVGMRIDLVVHIDRELHEDVVHVAENASWTHGVKRVHVWPQHMGLMGQWMDAWQPEHEPESQAINILLEDDLEVSKDFASWFLSADERFKDDASVSSITGMRLSLKAVGDGAIFSWDDPMMMFKYRLMGTWSLAPRREEWIAFRAWFETRWRNPGYHPLNLPNIIPVSWYNEFKQRGEEHRMWEIPYIQFMSERRTYTVYPWVAGGAETIVGNHRESGLNHQGMEGLDYPLHPHPFLATWAVVCLGWDAKEEPCQERLRGGGHT